MMVNQPVECMLAIYQHDHTHRGHNDFAHIDLNHVELDRNILITFIPLISKLNLNTFILIILILIALILILITNLFKTFELKQDGPAEEGGMIEVR